MRAKSPTDEYWNQRALTEADDAKVNMPDTVQRDHELQFIFQYLLPHSRVLEVGCGNGYVTQQIREKVSHVDAFDYAENMIKRALSTFGEKNSRFFVDDVLDPQEVKPPYDTVVCVRVLMNLRNHDEQTRAVANIAKVLREGGQLILVDGFQDGFETLNEIRTKVGLPPVTPAAHNFHCAVSELLSVATREFVVQATWHTGVYDFLTRVVFPQLVGPENATRPGEFHSKIEPIVRAHAVLEGMCSESLPIAPVSKRRDMEQYARVRGFVLTRR
jgi:SAM-dependent methyltransferase